MESATTPTIVFVDVDDTLVRSFGSKRIPRTEMAALVPKLKGQGAMLYCWSSGGAAYAREVAEELGIADCFEAFLPKPHLLIDDMPIDRWRLVEIHPTECSSMEAADVLRKRIQF